MLRWCALYQDDPQQEVCTELRQLKDAGGEPYINGHTTADGTMVILNDGRRIETEALARLVIGGGIH